MKIYQPTIMDCTLRDGSYSIDFQFNKKDTKLLVNKLSKAKIPFIEVGHGVGLGASKKGFGLSASTDKEYCKAAASGISNSSKWGVFCIPGIASLDDLKMTFDYDIDFVRIGTNIENVDSSKEFIQLAKKHKVTVFANFMKSYTVSPKKFAATANKSYDFGSEVIYIVDSSGGMYPDQLEQYIKEVQNINQNIDLGFHGHNNLGMGMANCLTSIKNGVKYIDATLQGIGRSSGNVVLEHLCCALKFNGLANQIDPIDIMDIGEKYIRPLLKSVGISSLDITAGWKLFHSSYMLTVLKISKKYKIDPRRLIEYLFDHKIKDLTEENLEIIASQNFKLLNKSQNLKNWPIYFGNEETYGQKK